MVSAIKRPNEKRCAWRDRQRHCHCWNCEKKKANEREDIENGGDDAEKTSVRNVEQCKDNKGIRATQRGGDNLAHDIVAHDRGDLGGRAIQFPAVGTGQECDEPAIDPRPVGDEINGDDENKEELSNSAERNGQNGKKLL